jgi:D-glycero-D-manno-heptose 1,7-bisphosphate phosphatase
MVDPRHPLRPAVFLDRDGVINRAFTRAGIPHPPACLADLELLPNVVEAVKELKAHGYRLVVVTNQPDVARGIFARELVEAIHEHLKVTLGLDAVFSCFHDDADGCDCRKPAPGMLLRAAQELGIDLKSSFMVGDRWRDVEAGRRAGCRTFFIDCGYAEKSPESCDFRVGSLAEAVRIISTQRLLQ